MAHCRKCGVEIYPGKRICRSCLHDWSNMRKEAFEFCQGKYGKLSAETLPILQKAMKRLDKLWRSDPEAFYKEIAPQDTIEGVAVQQATAQACQPQKDAASTH